MKRPEYPHKLLVQIVPVDNGFNRRPYFCEVCPMRPTVTGNVEIQGCSHTIEKSQIQLSRKYPPSTHLLISPSGFP